VIAYVVFIGTCFFVLFSVLSGAVMKRKVGGTPRRYSFHGVVTKFDFLNMTSFQSRVVFTKFENPKKTRSEIRYSHHDDDDDVANMLSNNASGSPRLNNTSGCRCYLLRVIPVRSWI
jgi:hypothetical protein